MTFLNVPRRLVKRWLKIRARRNERTVRLSAEAIEGALFEFGSPRGRLLVHSSLSACGYIEGGSAAVISAVGSWCSGGTLAMPAHSYCYPVGAGRAPIFDPARSESRVGAVTEYFRRQAGVVRSLHPTHSLVALGAEAAELCAGHEECDTPCGPGTPYEKLVKGEASVLMFGAKLDSYTLFHTAEDAAAVPYLYLPDMCDLALRSPSGEVRGFRMWRQDMSVERRFGEMDRWLEERGLLVRKRLGRGELLFLRQTEEVHRALVEELMRDPLLLVSEAGRAFLKTRGELQPGRSRHQGAAPQ